MTTKKQAAIGLFGGTFDPVHLGHTHIAEVLIDTLKLNEMQFIPNNHPMYRDEPTASARHRSEMIKLAINKNPKFTMNDIEIRREGPTYTIDTLKEIRRENPEQPLCLILGRDVFAKMSTWHHWENIIEFVHIISINRPDSHLPNDSWMQNLLKEHEIIESKQLETKPGGYILQFEMDPMNVSATEIRSKLKQQNDVSNLLDTEVLNYIHEHHLYT